MSDRTIDPAASIAPPNNVSPANAPLAIVPPATHIPLTDAAIWEKRVGTGALGAMVVGAVGPWAAAFGMLSVSGLNGDGIVVLILAAIAALAGWRYLAKHRRGALIAILVCGILGSATTVYDMVHISSGPPLVSIGWGLVLAFVGSITLAGDALAALITRRGRG